MLQIRPFKHFKDFKLLRVKCIKESLEDLVQLLQNQSSLDTLQLYGITENFNLNLRQDFKVRRLFLDFGAEMPQCLDFALQFSGRIEILSFYGGPNQEIFGQIVKNFPTIKALRYFEDLPEDMTTFNTAKVNPNLTELV